MTAEPHSSLGLPFGQRQAVFDLPQRVRLLDRSDLGCVLVNCAVEAAEGAAACSEALGVPLPLEPGLTSRSANRVALWSTPRSWLVQCAVEDEEDLAQAVNERFPDKTVAAVLYSDALAWLELEGPSSWDLLTEGAFVTLERSGLGIARCKRTLVAGIRRSSYAAMRCAGCSASNAAAHATSPNGSAPWRERVRRSPAREPELQRTEP